MEVTGDNVLGVAAFAYGLMIVIAALTAVLIRGMVMALGKAQQKAAGRKADKAEEPVTVQVTSAPVPDDVGRVAAIAAAVFATIGAHRLVYIGEATTGAWKTTGRVIHHTSHQPRRSPDA